ncbi:TPA: hypothetical protein SIA39_003913 [Aeromonas sobria]|nr:hypothetical protein [Aeromonas sobria]
MKVPLACFTEQGMLYQKMNSPFLMCSEEAVEFDVGTIRFVPNSDGLPADAVTCPGA